MGFVPDDGGRSGSRAGGDEPAEAPLDAEILCADPSLARRLAAALREANVPCDARERSDGRGVLVVAGSHYPGVWRSLAAHPDVRVEAEPEPWLRLVDPSRDRVISDHPVLREPAEALVRRGEAALDDLRECVRHGRPSVVHLALLQLGRLGVAALPALDAMLIDFARGGNAAAVRSILESTRCLAGRGPALPASLVPLRALVRDGSEDSRRIAIELLGRLRAFEALPEIADALLDESDAVAIEADDAFLEWGAPDEGFDPGMEPNEKRAIAERRRSFRPSP